MRSAVTAAVAAALLAGCTALPEPPTAGPRTEPATTEPPTVEPPTTEPPTTEPPTEPATTEPAAEPTESFVYFLVDTRTGIRLAREVRELPADDAVAAAVEAMIAGPDDPDYAAGWDPGTDVLGVEETGDAVVVDLSEDARTANIGSEGAAMMVQQLVHTVGSAAGRDVPVELLVDGSPAGELWGVLVWDEPVAAEQPMDVRSPVQIDEPAEGARATSPLTVAGEANVFEATVPWRVLDETGTAVATGYTMTSEGQTFAPFTFTVELMPGTYTVEVSEGDPSGGAAGSPTVDTRTVTVR